MELQPISKSTNRQKSSAFIPIELINQEIVAEEGTKVAQAFWASPRYFIIYFATVVSAAGAAAIVSGFAASTFTVSVVVVVVVTLSVVAVSSVGFLDSQAVIVAIPAATRAILINDLIC